MQSHAEPQPGTRVGPLLRDRRLRAGIGVREASQRLRIRQIYLEAIETGQFEALPAPVCALGFVRSYAQLLQLDADEIGRRFKAEIDRHPAAPLRFPLPIPTEAGKPTGAFVLLGAIIAVGAYTAWHVTSHNRMESARVAPVPERLEQLLDDGNVPEAGSARSWTLEDTRHTAASPASGASQEETVAAGDLAAMLGSASTPGERAAGNARAAEPASRTASTTTDATGRIVLQAKADSWVEVRDPASTTKLVARLLRQGEVYDIPDRPGLKLLTGNAGGLVIMVDGKVAPPLGRDGMVRRDVDLHAESLRASSNGAGLQ